ncbi:MAG: hypothetical protein IPL06_15835 [Betaproteobacteria bacterium]|nr:hypothetical protein [Betaproteobacteria bacterium]
MAVKFPPPGSLVGAVVVSGVIGGVYVVAATTASSMAGTFTTTESDQRTSRAESQSAMTRASARFAMARERCEQYRYAKRELCQSAARRDERRNALRDAPTEEVTP